MYYFSPAYRQEEPRVILLIGSAWRPKLRAHYGIDCPAFFRREAYAGEPDHYPNRHPWGWVFRPEKVLEYERHSGRLSAEDFAELESALRAKLAGLPFGATGPGAATPAANLATHTGPRRLHLTGATA